MLGADSIFNYETLPRKYWKKYMTASRFIQLVKAKKPKVTYFSAKAKCMLMETLEDFEMIYYTGEKLIKSPVDGIQISDFHNESIKHSMMEHFNQCYSHCMNIERCLRTLESDETDCFPVVIGTKPKNNNFGLSSSKSTENNMLYSQRNVKKCVKFIHNMQLFSSNFLYLH